MSFEPTFSKDNKNNKFLRRKVDELSNYYQNHNTLHEFLWQHFLIFQTKWIFFDLHKIKIRKFLLICLRKGVCRMETKKRDINKKFAAGVILVQNWWGNIFVPALIHILLERYFNIDRLINFRFFILLFNISNRLLHSKPPSAPFCLLVRSQYSP